MRPSQETTPSMAGFRAVVVRAGRRPVVAVHGEVDLATADEVAAAVDEALRGANRLELDLRHMTFMDSTGLGVLVATYRRLGQVREAIVVRDPTPSIRRLLEITGVERYVTVRSGEDARPGPAPAVPPSTAHG